MCDSYKTCKDCPNRSLSCRSSCAGWQFRELVKKGRYKETLRKQDDYYRLRIGKAREL